MNQNQELFNLLGEAATEEFIARIQEPVFKASDIPLTYRVINHWHQENLFPYKQESGRWRMFSMVDYIWVLFVNRLRLMDVGLKAGAKIKAQCFASIYLLLEQSVIELMTTSEPGAASKSIEEGVMLLGDPETREQLESPLLRLFSLWLMLAIQKNADVLIRILPDEKLSTDFVLLKEEHTDTAQIVQNIAKKGGLFISMQSLLNEFYGSERFTWENIKKLEIDKEARTIIALMREKGIKQLVIKLDEGKVKHVQTEKKEQLMSQEEFSNAVISKKFVEYKIVKNEGEKLIVSAKENFRIKDGAVNK